MSVRQQQEQQQQHDQAQCAMEPHAKSMVPKCSIFELVHRALQCDASAMNTGNNSNNISSNGNCSGRMVTASKSPQWRCHFSVFSSPVLPRTAHEWELFSLGYRCVAFECVVRIHCHGLSLSLPATDFISFSRVGIEQSGEQGRRCAGAVFTHNWWRCQQRPTGDDLLYDYAPRGLVVFVFNSFERYN